MTKSSTKEPVSIWPVACLVVAVFIVWAISLVVISKLLPSWSDRAAFGESFGAVNALFSGLALGGVILAILLQRQDLQLQRVELELTRKELERTAVSQEETKRLTELDFLMGLLPRFTERRASYNAAWSTFYEIDEKVTSSDDPRWEATIEALEKYYACAAFLYQVAVLTNRGALNVDSVYLLYYDYIVEHPDGLFRSLADWCGTGNELAANYNWRDVVRMSKEVLKLLERLENIHQLHGGETYDWMVPALRKVSEELTERGDPYALDQTVSRSENDPSSGFERRHAD